jgi:hypothetical protein
VQEAGTVTFFLYFSTEGEAARAQAALTAEGCAPQEILPPDDPVDETWSLSAEWVLESHEVAGVVVRVRSIAEAAGGELDGVVTPWPVHPEGFPPQRPPRG